jgi:D-tyrosyl-tRNA(Tyr) deacylase
MKGEQSYHTLRARLIRLAILQRVLSASVTVDRQLISSIGKGILVFAAVAPGDTEKDADALAAKVLKMRLWDDESGGRVSGK